MVGWEPGNAGLLCTRLDLNGRPIGDVIQLSAFPFFVNSEYPWADVSVAMTWNSVTNEFGVVYDAPAPTFNFVNAFFLARIRSDGVIVSRTTLLSHRTRSFGVSVNSSTGNYIVLAGSDDPCLSVHPGCLLIDQSLIAHTDVIELDRQGTIVGRGKYSQLDSDFGFASLAFSPVSQTFLVVVGSFVGGQLFELNQHGVPMIRSSPSAEVRASTADGFRLESTRQ